MAELDESIGCLLNITHYQTKHEQCVASKIKEASKMELFYKLPFPTILEIIRNVQFSNDTDDIIIIKRLAENISNYFPDQSALFFHCLPELMLSLRDFSSILKCFSSIPFFQSLSEAIDYDMTLPYYDSTDELNSKDKTITELKKRIEAIIKWTKPLIEKSDHKYQTNIFDAISKKDLPSVIKIIEENHSTVNQRDKHGLTPLHHSIRNNTFDITKYLVIFGCANVNICKKGKQNIDSPLHFACSQGDIETVKLLCDFGANLTANNSHGDQPVSIACLSGDLPIVQYLVETKHVSLDIYNQYRQTPLHNACFSKSLPLVKYLVMDQNMNVNCTDSNNETPLFKAIHSESQEIVKFLLSQKVKISIKNHDGISLLDSARDNDMKYILKYEVTQIHEQLVRSLNSIELSIKPFLDTRQRFMLKRFITEKKKIAFQHSPEYPMDIKTYQKTIDEVENYIKNTMKIPYVRPSNVSYNL